MEDIAKYYADDLLVQQPNSKSYICGIADGIAFTRAIFLVHLGLLTVNNKAMFPNIHTLLCIICTLPVTSCECKCLGCCAALKGSEAYSLWNGTKSVNRDEILNIFAGRMLLSIIYYQYSCICFVALLQLPNIISHSYLETHSCKILDMALV